MLIFLERRMNFQNNFGKSSSSNGLYVFYFNFQEQELNIFLGKELCGNQIKIATCGLIEPNLLFHTKWNMN